MRLSIAMCTHNGETFLSSQLGSMLRQIRPPDELVVCDDASVDDTFEVLEQFAVRAPFAVRIYRNDTKLGSTANFQRAIELCSGDVIVLADQDDIWLKNRLSVTKAAFDRDPQIAMFFSNAAIIDETSRPLGLTLWKNLRFGSKDQRRFKNGGAFEMLLRRNFATGATMAFRSSLRKFLLPIPELWVHDAWIALLCSFLGKVSIDRSTLINYRQHTGQQIGAAQQSWKKGLQNAQSKTHAFYSDEAERFSLLRRRLSPDLATLPQYGNNLRCLDHKLAFCYERLHCAQRGYLSFLVIARNIVRMRYSHYANGWRGAGTDVIAALRRLG